jgi:hypothetical protein
MNTSFTENMAKFILNGEQSPNRFEAFCCELYSHIDSCTYVTTSWNYDQGRDGRTSDLRNTEHPPIICSSLRFDVINKATEDAEKLSSKPFKPTIIRFCTILADGKDATEYTLDKVKSIFEKRVPSAQTVICDGVIQLARYSVKYPNCFEKYYLSELQTLRTALSVDAGNAAHVQLTGMRIALTTQFSSDAKTLKNDLQKNLILSVLSMEDCTIDLLCKNVSESLHLPRIVDPAYLRQTLVELETEKLINKNNETYSISEYGIQELVKRTENGARNLIDGQELIRQLLYELTGESIEPNNFTNIWNVIQESIANMFLNNGIYIIQSIESIIKGQSSIKEHENLHDSIINLAERVANLKLWGNRQRDIYRAILDMFHEANSSAFQWLTQLGTIYISLCSLGLEPSSQQQIEQSLSNLDLLLDTDIVLSFLSKGEPNHEAISSVVHTWQRIHGNIYVAPGVLEETAYHAWISQLEYEDIWRDLEKYDDNSALRLINNVFVRGFRAESPKKFSRKYWNYYINNFIGQEPYDYSKIEEILSVSYILKTSDQNIDQDLANEVQNQLVKMKSDMGDEIDQETLDKHRRDGLLIAILLRHRKSGLNKKALVVSSSTKLSEACTTFKDKLGSLDPVAPIGALAYLLTMISGINLDLGTLKGLLFNTGYAEKIRGIETVALRMLQASEEYFMPFSRRPTLQRALSNKIVEVATQLGRKPEEVAKDFERKKLDAESMTHIVATSIDSMIKSKSEKIIEEKDMEIRQLKRRE